MPPAAGLRAHVELSRISGYVVCNTYRIAPWDGSTSGEGTQSPSKVMWMLGQWKISLLPRLQLSPDGLSNDPACCMLHMRYNQLVIVATRPLFFIAVKKSVAQRLTSQPGSKDDNAQLGHLKSCIDAASSNMRLARHFAAINRHNRPLHAMLHYVFSAAVCLILQDLVYPQTDGSSEETLSRSRDIQYGLSTIEEMDNHLLDTNDRSCTSTLSDLRVLVARLTTSNYSDHQSTAGSLQALGMASDFQPPAMHIETEPALYNELVNWMDDDWFMYGTYMD